MLSSIWFSPRHNLNSLLSLDKDKDKDQDKVWVFLASREPLLLLLPYSLCSQRRAPRSLQLQHACSLAAYELPRGAYPLAAPRLG